MSTSTSSSAILPGIIICEFVARKSGTEGRRWNGPHERPGPSFREPAETIYSAGDLTMTIRDCESFEEKLYFCIRHIFRLRSQPDELGGEYFDSLFKESALANLTAEELEQYNRTMTTERDIRNQIKYAQEQGFEAGKAEGMAEGKAEGKAEGIEENKLNNARQLKVAGVALETIATCIGLDIETVKAL